MGAALAAALPTEHSLSSTTTGLNSRSDYVSIQSIIGHLPAEPSLIGLVNPNKSSKKDKSANDQTRVAQELVSVLCVTDNSSFSGRQNAFMTSGGGGLPIKKVQIEYEIIGKRLRLRVFESFVRERLGGDEAVKVVRILLSMGKLNEEQVCGRLIRGKKCADGVVCSGSDCADSDVAEEGHSAAVNASERVGAR